MAVMAAVASVSTTAMPPDYKCKSAIDKMVACVPHLPSSPIPKESSNQKWTQFVCKNSYWIAHVCDSLTWKSHFSILSWSPLLSWWTGKTLSPCWNSVSLALGIYVHTYTWEEFLVYICMCVHQGVECSIKYNTLACVSMHKRTYCIRILWAHSLTQTDRPLRLRATWHPMWMLTTGISTMNG